MILPRLYSFNRGCNDFVTTLVVVVLTLQHCNGVGMSVQAFQSTSSTSQTNGKSSVYQGLRVSAQKKVGPTFSSLLVSDRNVLSYRRVTRAALSRPLSTIRQSSLFLHASTRTATTTALTAMTAMTEVTSSREDGLALSHWTEHFFNEFLSFASTKVADMITPFAGDLFSQEVITEIGVQAVLLSPLLLLLIVTVEVVSTRLIPAKLLDSSLLRAIAEGTYLERNVDKLQCVYKASKDGWSALRFHEAVDGKGSGIVVARTLRSRRTFGGYNANGWRSTDDYYSSTSSFLWYQQNQQNQQMPQGTKTTRANEAVKKLRVLPGGDAAVFDYASAGPCFGASDLLIGPPRAAVMGGFAGPDAEDLSTSAGSLRYCQSSIGSSYDARDAPHWPARGDNVQLLDVEVYCVVTL